MSRCIRSPLAGPLASSQAARNPRSRAVFDALAPMTLSVSPSVRLSVRPSVSPAACSLSPAVGHGGAW